MLLTVAAVCGMYFWIACGNASDKVTDYTLNISADPNVFTDADKLAAKHIIDLHRKYGNDFELNFADPLQYRHFKKQLYNSGYTEQSNPQLFKTLEATRQEHLKQNKKQEVFAAVSDSGYNDTVAHGVRIITSLGYNAASSLQTSGLLSFPYDDSLITATIDIAMYTSTGTPVGNSDSASGYSYAAITDLQVETSGSLPVSLVSDPGRDTVHSSMDYFYLTKDQVPHWGSRYAAVTTTVDTLRPIKPVPCVLASPVAGCPCSPPDPCSGSQAKCVNDTSIVVCMTRTSPNCTYCNQGLATSLMFPIEGYSVYKQNIKVDVNNKPINAISNITVTRLPAGGGCPAIPLTGNFFDYTRVGGDTLFWNLNQAVFQNNCLKSGDSVLFSMMVKVVIGASTSSYIYLSNSYLTVPAVDVAKIAPITIVSGCVAEGTMITMADGKQKKIESVGINEKLKSDNAHPLSVDYSVSGVEPKPCVRIIDSQGHNLLMTEGHPVITPKGVVLAMNLKVGDSVLTVNGVAKIISITWEQYNGDIWNLSVGTKDDQVPITRSNTTFYANGILVGDHKMQQNYLYNGLGQSPDQVLNHLPVEWRQDYLNSRKSK